MEGKQSGHSSINGKERSTFKILLVDEDSERLHQVCTMLKGYGFTNHTHTSEGLEALALFSKQIFDLVMIDVKLKDIDGFMAGAAMKGMERYREVYTPIIAISSIDGRLKKDSAKAGLDDFEKAPYEKETIERKIIHWLQFMQVTRQLNL